MFFLFQSIVSIILLGIQFYFFRKTKRIAENIVNQQVKLLIHTFFVLVSLPLVLLLFFHSPLYILPQWLIYGGVYPFYIWHFSCLIFFLLIMLGKIFKLPFLSAQWLLKK